MLIAKRELQVIEKGQSRPLPVEIHAPVATEHDFVVAYEIGWPGAPRKSFAAGVDAMQALHLALQKIGGELYASKAHAEGRLSWPGQGEGYGFPVPNTARDMLVGNDKRFL